MAGNNKTWKDVWDLYWNEKVRDLHTSFPARITKIDHQLNRCNVQPVVSTKYPDDRQLPFPELENLPYQIYSANGGNARFTVPLAIGDIVEVSVSERDLSLFLSSDGSEIYNSQTLSLHNLTSAMVKPCFYPTGTAKEVDSTNIVIENGSTTIKVAPSGDITMDSTTRAVVTVPETEFNSNVTINGTLDVTEAANFGSTIDAIGDVVGAGVSLETHLTTGVTVGTGVSGVPQKP